MTNIEPSRQDPGAWWPRGWRRLHVVILCFALASVVALIVQRVVPPPATDVALISAVWITFYPVARLKRSEPWWAHWARGIVILVAFLMAQRFFS
jgi:4-hydroxybenzoate polyprenyltransferase